MPKDVVTDNHQNGLLQTSDRRAVLVAASTNSFRDGLAKMMEQNHYNAIQVIPTSDDQPTNVHVAVFLLTDDMPDDFVAHYLDHLLQRRLPILLLHYTDQADKDWQALAKHFSQLVRYRTGRQFFAYDFSYHFLQSIREGNGLAASLHERRELNRHAANASCL